MANSQFIKARILADNSLREPEVSLPIGATETVLLEVRTTNVISKGVEYEPATVQAYYQFEDAESIIIVPQLLKRVEAIPADPDNGIEAEYTFNAIINPVVLNSAGKRKLYIRFEVADANGLKLNKTDFLSVSVSEGTSEAQVVSATLGAELEDAINDLEDEIFEADKTTGRLVPKDLANNLENQDVLEVKNKFYVQDDSGVSKYVTLEQVIEVLPNNGLFETAQDLYDKLPPNELQEERRGQFAGIANVSSAIHGSGLSLETTIPNERVQWNVDEGNWEPTGLQYLFDTSALQAQINNLDDRLEDVEDDTQFIASDDTPGVEKTIIQNSLEITEDVKANNGELANLTVKADGVIALSNINNDLATLKAGADDAGNNRLLVNDKYILNEDDEASLESAINQIETNINGLTTDITDLNTNKLESLPIIQSGATVSNARNLNLDNTFTVSAGANNTANISVNVDGLNIQQNTSQITASNAVLEGGANQQVINQRHELVSKKFDDANQPEGMVILDSEGKITEDLLPTGFNVLLDYFRILQNGQTTGDITNAPSTTNGFQLPWTATTSMTQFAMFNEDLTASAGIVLQTEDFTEINVPIFELEQDRQYIVEAEAFVKRGQTTTSIFKGQRAIDGVIDDTIDIITPSTLTNPFEVLENDELEWQFRIQVDQGSETGYILVYDQFNPMTVRYNFSAGVVTNANQVLTTIRGESLNQQLFNERVDQEINYQTALNDTNADLYFDFKDPALRQGHHLFLKVPETLNQPLSQIRISIDNGQTYVGLFQHDQREQELPVFGSSLLGDHIQIVYDADSPAGARWELINSDSDRLTNIRFQDEVTRYVIPARRVAGSNDFEFSSIKSLTTGRIYLVDIPEILDGGGIPQLKANGANNYYPIWNSFGVPITEEFRSVEGAQAQLEFRTDHFLYILGSNVATNVEANRLTNIAFAQAFGNLSGNVAELDANKLDVKATDGNNSNTLNLTPNGFSISKSQLISNTIQLTRPYDAIELSETVSTRGIALANARNSATLTQDTIFELDVQKDGNGNVTSIMETGRTFTTGLTPGTVFGLLASPDLTRVGFRTDFEVPGNNRVWNTTINYSDFSRSAISGGRIDDGLPFSLLTFRALEWATPYELFFITLQGALYVLDTRTADPNVAEYTVPNSTLNQAFFVGAIPNTANFAVRKNNGTYTLFVQPQDDATRIIEYSWNRTNNEALRFVQNIPKGAQFPSGSFIRMFYDKTTDLALQYAVESQTLYTGTTLATPVSNFPILDTDLRPIDNNLFTFNSTNTGNEIIIGVPDTFDLTAQEFIDLCIERNYEVQITIGNITNTGNARLTTIGDGAITGNIVRDSGQPIPANDVALSVLRGKYRLNFFTQQPEFVEESRTELAVPSSTTATVNTLMLRDNSGRSQVVAPSNDFDIANKFYVDTELGNRDGIIDQNSGQLFKKWYGTETEYDAIDDKDPLTEYNITQ